MQLLERLELQSHPPEQMPEQNPVESILVQQLLSYNKHHKILMIIHMILQVIVAVSHHLVIRIDSLRYRPHFLQVHHI